VAQDQRVEFLFAAQVSGQEQLQKLISSVDSLRKETEQLKSANAGLASSTNAVISNGVRYNNALDAQSKALRQNRQGTQQLGLQINDFATSVSTGASPLQAFNQQIGQVGYAMSQMGGVAGRIGAFLAGPWGAAVVIGTMAVSALWGMMNQAPEVNDKFANALSRSRDALFDYQVTLAKTREEVLALYETKLAGLQFEFQKSATDAGKFGRKVQESKNVLDNWRTKPIWQVGAAMYQNTVATGKYNEATEKTLDLNTEMLQLQNTLAQMRKRHATEDTRESAKALRAGEAAAKKLENEANKRAREAEAALEKESKSIEAFMDKIGKVGMKEIPAYQREIAQLEKDFMELSKVGQAATIAPFKAAVESIEMSAYSDALKDDLKEADRMVKDALPDLGEQPVSKEMEAIISRNEELNNSFQTIGMSVSNAFKGMLTGATSFKNAMSGIINAVIDELFRLFVVQQIVGMISGAIGGLTGTPVSPGKGFGSSVNLAGRARGGSVGNNQPYMVGEQGPELFIPGGSGTIIPNRNLSSNGGGSSFNISVDARGSNDPAAVRAQVQQGILEAAPAIIAAAESRTISSMRRPRLGGAMQ
jgi:chromosome segregation ATPase